MFPKRGSAQFPKENNAVFPKEKHIFPRREFTISPKEKLKLKFPLGRAPSQKEFDNAPKRSVQGFPQREINLKILFGKGLQLSFGRGLSPKRKQTFPKRVFFQFGCRMTSKYESGNRISQKSFFNTIFSLGKVCFLFGERPLPKESCRPSPKRI